MPTEPQPPTLAEVVNRAVDVCDPVGTNDAIAEYQRRLEDRDEPVTALPRIEEELAEVAGALDPESEDPAFVMAVAVTVHLAFRRSELGLEREELLQQAARAQFDGRPPEHVADWLSQQGVEL
jgi:hypothetical protein